MKTSFRFLILISTAAMAGTVYAQEQAAPPAPAPVEGPMNVERKAAICATCHGPGGISAQPAFPTLAGQHKDYLVQALKAYKSGQRKNAVMSGQAVGLSDADIMELATYFSKQKGPLYVPALD